MIPRFKSYATSQNCDLGEVTQLLHAILSTSELLDTLLQSPYCNISQRIIVCAKMESLSFTAQIGLNSAMILLFLSPECWITGNPSLSGIVKRTKLILGIL